MSDVFFTCLLFEDKEVRRFDKITDSKSKHHYSFVSEVRSSHNLNSSLRMAPRNYSQNKQGSNSFANIFKESCLNTFWDINYHINSLKGWGLFRYIHIRKPTF